MDFMDKITPWVTDYGYVFVFFGIILDTLGVPFPGETLFMAAGICAAQGMIDPFWVVVLGALATSLANNATYALGRAYGRKFVARWGKYIFLSEATFIKMGHFIGEYGNVILIWCRFIPTLRQLNGLVAGTARMPWRRYFFYNMLNAVLWSSCWTAVGFYSGKSIVDGNYRVLIISTIFGFLMLLFAIRTFYAYKPKTEGTFRLPALSK